MPQLITPNTLRAAGREQPLIQVVDVGREPALKAALLSGRLTNLAAPFIYHDPAKQLALILMPMELNLSEIEQQRVIGQLTQIVMRSLPEDAPRAYLLQPRLFFSLQSLIEAILEADGVTPEMLRAQQERVDLLRDLVRLLGDEASLRERARENDAKIDATFFEILTASLEANLASGRAQAAQQLSQLNKILLEETTYGRALAKRAAAIEAFRKSPSRETLLDQLIAVEDTETRQTLITLGRQLLDYAFFQLLTKRIDAADEAGKQQLIALRKEIQEIRDKIDAASRAFLESKLKLIEEIAASNNPIETARKHVDELDDALLSVLQANLQDAERAGDKEAVAALERVEQAVMQAIAERQPPEVQMVNMLLAAKYPEETEKLLNEWKDTVDDRLISVLAQFADQLAQQDRTDLSAKLTKVMVQARKILPKYDPGRDTATPPPKPTIEIARR
ncbi:MAG: hypothetical protein J7601_07330 [Chloroflexi bacterium]|jgi:hypothetical protein|nr:hypothetical protein [Chloroflexota bacterium]